MTLASWLQTGAPLDFSEPIPNTGIFPPVESMKWDLEAAKLLAREFEGWQNHPSANEFESDLNQLVRDALDKGFCSLSDSVEEATCKVGIEPTFNKLGVIVKERAGKRKARIIWDLRESGVNKLCSQGERILLPRLSDVVGDALDVFRRGGTASFFAIDVRDAFHNIPAGKDRAYTSAVVNIDGRQQILTFDVLVFGSVSSPTLWGRFAAWFGRTLAVVNPEVAMQVYVDDPIMVFDSQNPARKTLLGKSLLWAAITGLPIKLEKTDAGNEVKWIGALIKACHDTKAIKVTIPADKVAELVQKIDTMLAKPVVGRKQLQSLAGALSFVAGIVPLMRPFLGALWAVLATMNDGSNFRTRNVVHTRRIRHALEWIRAVLEGKQTPLVRTLRAFRPTSGVIILTDASTWGLGAVMLEQGEPKEFFSCPIPPEFILRTGAIPGIPKHMTLWEALCLLLAARTWLTKHPIGSVVRVKADNIGALYLIAKGKASSPELSMVAREIALDQANEKYEFTILQHINTKLNKTADPLSRQHDPNPPPFPENLQGATRVPIEVGPEFWLLPETAQTLRREKRRSPLCAWSNPHTYKQNGSNSS